MTTTTEESARKPESKPLVTCLFEIESKADFEGSNMMGKIFNGMRCIGVSVGDLMAMSDAFEDAAPEAYDKASEVNITANWKLYHGEAAK